MHVGSGVPSSLTFGLALLMVRLGVEATVKTVQQLDKRTSLVEYRRTGIEHTLSK